ncbi:hypothetical protein ACU686_03365 [Yinghuangia aomiensis]
MVRVRADAVAFDDNHHVGVAGQHLAASRPATLPPTTTAVRMAILFGDCCSQSATDAATVMPIRARVLCDSGQVARWGQGPVRKSPVGPTMACFRPGADPGAGPREPYHPTLSSYRPRNAAVGTADLADRRPRALLTPGFAPQLGGSVPDPRRVAGHAARLHRRVGRGAARARRSRSGTDYAGWVYRRDLGPIGITDVGIDPVRVARTARAIRRSTDAFFLLSIAQRPTWSLHAEHQTSMGGDAVLLDSAQPFRLAADDFGHHVRGQPPQVPPDTDLSHGT